MYKYVRCTKKAINELISNYHVHQLNGDLVEIEER